MRYRGVYREGCAAGESCLDRALGGEGRQECQTKYIITVLRNKVGVFLRKIVVH